MDIKYSCVGAVYSLVEVKALHAVARFGIGHATAIVLDRSICRRKQRENATAAAEDYASPEPWYAGRGLDSDLLGKPFDVAGGGCTRGLLDDSVCTTGVTGQVHGGGAEHRNVISVGRVDEVRTWSDWHRTVGVGSRGIGKLKHGVALLRRCDVEKALLRHQRAAAGGCFAGIPAFSHGLTPSGSGFAGVSGFTVSHYD